MPTEYGTLTVQVPSYRGVENPFGHLWKWTDGCKCLIQSDASGGLSEFYVCDTPANFTSSGVAGYEPFATLFDLRGSMVQWALLIIVVLASLVMYRPFCNYLCPMDPVIDIIAATRRWIKETWSSWRAKPANP